MRNRYGVFMLAFLAAAAPVRAQTALTVVTAQPTGELARREQAAEVRIRFSEAMVPIGRLTEQLTAPFFSIRPAVTGTFRWASPTLLVFTPDPKTPLPYATRYEVAIAPSAAAVSGRTLGRPYTFTFTTPTVRLLQTNWYRLNGRFDQPLIIPLRFNQPVRSADITAHVTLQYQRHDWVRPSITPAERARMGAEAARFDAKVAATLTVVNSEAPVAIRTAGDWDTRRFPAASDLVVLQTLAAPSPDGWLRITVDTRVPAIEGSATPPETQSFTIPLEPTLFVDDFRCTTACDADRHNAARLRSNTALTALVGATTVRDITNRAREVPVARAATSERRRDVVRDDISYFTFEDLGFDRQPPDSAYAVTIDARLPSLDGQTLGYTWTGLVDNWHDRALASFGDGHGVWETGGGPLPFYARNLVDVWQWARGIPPDRLMPTILDLRGRRFRASPPGDGVHRTLGGAADKMLSHGLDLSGALSRAGTGLVWAAVKPGEPIARSRLFESASTDTVASIVQVTNLGISVKDSPQNTLVFVTRLDTGAPVGGAGVSIIRLDNTTAWTSRTDDHGIAIAPQLRLRNPRRSWELGFIVTATKDGDTAYVGSDWNEGIQPYEFGAAYNLDESQPLLRGTVFSDRGVYKLGEEVHFKAILRRDTPSGIELIPNATPVYIALRDSHAKMIDRRTVAVNTWSTTEWTVRLPASGALGDYRVLASLEKTAFDQRVPRPRREEEEEAPEEREWRQTVSGGFLVAAYRRPEFRVDANLAGEVALAGSPLKGGVNARYLFGAAMTNRPVTWSFSRSPMFGPPAAVTNQFPGDRFVFVGCCDANVQPENGRQSGSAATLDAKGQLALTLETQPSDGRPYQYTLEGDVEDVSRQHIAGRASFVVHPAPWYIGLKRPSLFVDQKDGLITTVVAATPEGKPVAGVKVDLALVEIQWHSVRRAEGNGFYTWETERKEVEAGRVTVTTAVDPVPLTVPVPGGGSFVIRAVAQEGPYRSSTRLPFYVVGSGYTAWARYDHNRIDLVPERETYKPGETARLMIQSPWEQATALLTVEREGIRSHTQFALTSTQQTVTVPITAADIPNLFVSVLLVKGRSAANTSSDDTSDPGKPAFRLGYAKLAVEDSSKRLSVTVKANKEEFRPAGSAKVDVQVNDAQGAGTASEVTLWAVDYGVLSLTAFRTPDVLRSVYVPKSLEVMNEDSRQRIVSRRVLTPKGEETGGGGGADAGVSQLRKDFRVLAFWLGSVTTNSRGHASTEIKLPESLTTYRVMAVSGDKASRFGSGESEIRINKPVVLQPAFPRFLVRGDKAFFGSVVTSQLKQAGTATVTMRSLDPDILQISGDGRRVVQVGAGGSAEVRFDVVAKAIGRARVQTAVRLGNESDAFEDSIPVEVLVTPETTAAYGEAAPDGKETVAVPTGIVPGFGGLHLELSSTALVGLGEGARYVVEYPYGCVEQRASRTFVLATAADLGDAFRLPGIDARSIRGEVQTSLGELEKFQCPSGGFALWPGACQTVSPFLTSYVLHVFQTAASLKYTVNPDVMRRGYDYLQNALAKTPPMNEAWWPAYTAWEAFAVRTLVDGGRNQDSNINRLFGYLDRMPVFAMAYLHDALAAKGESGARPAQLRRRMSNAVLPEGGTAHVEELNDPYLLWFWNSNVRSTALVLSTLVRASAPATEVSPMVRWLVAARKNGRWGNTQENAVAMQALVNYYRKYESVTPNFTAVARLGTDDLVRTAFKGRSTEVMAKNVPMAALTRIDTGKRDLTFRRDGDGTLFYVARLSYAPDTPNLRALDGGFHIERRYAPVVNATTGPVATSFAAGDLVRVTLTLDLPKERRFVAVTDPVPAGFEPVESWFATTAADIAKDADQQDGGSEPSWEDVWQRGTFDHVERHDDRVLLFATRLSEGHHEFSYVVRATTAGVFVTAPARAEEMYEPEVLGRTATETIEVKR